MLRRYGRLIPRVPRSLLPDGYFHVTTRGVAKSAIYRDDADRRFFLRLALLARTRYDWSFYALCLMDNHYHLVVDTARERLSLGMQELNGTYAQAFNRKYRRWGHLFGDRFASRVVGDEQHLHNVCAYVMQNPVRAGLCDRAAEWPWSHSRFALEDPD